MVELMRSGCMCLELEWSHVCGKKLRRVWGLLYLPGAFIYPQTIHPKGSSCEFRQLCPAAQHLPQLTDQMLNGCGHLQQ